MTTSRCEDGRLCTHNCFMDSEFCIFAVKCKVTVFSRVQQLTRPRPLRIFMNCLHVIGTLKDTRNSKRERFVSITPYFWALSQDSTHTQAHVDDVMTCLGNSVIRSEPQLNVLLLLERKHKGIMAHRCRKRRYFAFPKHACCDCYSPNKTFCDLANQANKFGEINLNNVRLPAALLN